MATVIRTNLRTILTQLRSRLANSLAWDQATVLICDPMRTRLNAHERYLYLWPSDGQFSRPIYVGAGRADTRETTRLEVTLMSRLAQDETNSQAQWLTDASLGHLLYRDQIIDALLEPWFPTDDGTDGGNILVTSPLKVGSWGRAQTDADDPFWGGSRIFFAFEYEMDLTQPGRS